MSTNAGRYHFGTEVEDTPAKGKYTMFVEVPDADLGISDKIAGFLEIIPGSDLRIKHIHFSLLPENKNKDWVRWTYRINTLLSEGYWVTLEVSDSDMFQLGESGLCEKPKFIAKIIVDIPYIGQLGYNTVLKIGEINRAKTNPGTWIHYLTDLTTRQHFTSSH